MPTKLFYELNDDKKQKIISIGISEFAKHGYDNSSTNRIVSHSGISKGSLFKYFKSKEELYLYLVDCVTEELTSNLNGKLDSLPCDLFKRVIKYSELEFFWYIQNPEKYKLIMKAFRKNDTDIYQKTEARFHHMGQDIFYNVFADIGTEQFRWNKQKTIDVLKWFLQGFNEDFISKMQTQDGDKQLDHIRNEYVNCLTDYIEILKKGFLK